MKVHRQATVVLTGSLITTLSFLGFTGCISQSSASFDSELTVVGFNVESGDSDPTTLADRYVTPLSGVDIWGFSEVENSSSLKALERGAENGEGTNFETILGTTGGEDRLAIAYNRSLLELIEHEELDELSFQGRARAALIAHFRIRQTGEEFLLMVNHLYRSETERRHQQAQMLNDWVRSQRLPVIAVGDYNFDFDVQTGDQGKRDPGFDLMTQHDAFRWVRPTMLTSTTCSDRYNSVLDFIFVAQGATAWPIKTSEILFSDSQSSYCPDDDATSDHRPVLATFDLSNP